LGPPSPSQGCVGTHARHSSALFPPSLPTPSPQGPRPQFTFVTRLGQLCIDRKVFDHPPVLCLLPRASPPETLFPPRPTEKGSVSHMEHLKSVSFGCLSLHFIKRSSPFRPLFSLLSAPPHASQTSTAGSGEPVSFLTEHGEESRPVRAFLSVFKFFSST